MIHRAINKNGYYHMAPMVTSDPETGEESTTYYTIPLSRTILRSQDGEYDEFTHNPDAEADKTRLAESVNFMAWNDAHLQAVNLSASRRGIVVLVADRGNETLEKYILAGKDTNLILDARGPGVYFKEEKSE
jgi:hypothetical protein